MSNIKKEMEKKMLIKRTLGEMDKQIQKLEAQKKSYIDAGKRANQQGLTDQYNLALSGLRMTIAQQKRVHEMKLNFEISLQMKDMTQMTNEFLKGMGSLCKDMATLTKGKGFEKVQKQFTNAMASVEMQTQRLETFMDTTEMAFSTGAPASEEERQELENLITNEAVSDNLTESMIDKELEELKKRME